MARKENSISCIITAAMTFFLYIFTAAELIIYGYSFAKYRYKIGAAAVLLLFTLLKLWKLFRVLTKQDSTYTDFLQDIEEIRQDFASQNLTYKIVGCALVVLACLIGLAIRLWWNFTLLVKGRK